MSESTDKTDIFARELKYLSGVGNARAELLFKQIEVFTYGDMLYHFPFRYIDRTRFLSVNQITPDMPDVQLRGKIVAGRTEATGQGRKRLIFTFSDGTGHIELIFFQGLTWFRDNIKLGIEYIIFGKPSEFNGEINLVHPEIEQPQPQVENEISNTKIHGIYPSTEILRNRISNKAIVQIVRNILNLAYGKIKETLPPYLIERYKLLSLNDALLNIHFPRNQELLTMARNRLKFDELFFIQLDLLYKRAGRIEKNAGIVFDKVGEHFNAFYRDKLPFPLTGAQKRVMHEIRKDMGRGKQMNRLLQGDVGSGKTLVALMSMLIAADNSYQSCLMAPTEILANQHYNSISDFLKGLNIKLALLTGSTKKSERKKIFANLSEGQINILIGTHALIEDSVYFRNLGLVVIDEQHRFGVEQRSRLWNKSKQLPHVMVMTATPIPRTLAMTLYGDLDVSVIDELPPGRKEIKTVVFNDNKRLRLFGFMKEQIKQGRQIYVVYPLIRESEKMDYKDLEDGYESIVRAFPPPEYVTAVVHGKMKPADKDFSMNLFVRGAAHIMVATSVIEVGVNVPNATVMVIESAERFGLAQLHQLRGRVGRGAEQSYCILMAGYKLSAESRRRLQLMASTSDGFKIAEEDLQLRGPGNIDGTQQSGLPVKLRISDLSKDGHLIERIREIAREILDNDPKLEADKNHLLKKFIEINSSKNKNFSEIS
ncbi:MAG: ATP-dependent DNA helicase RecG [Prevotellaceae bacterium]|jgi:ATP-dependent DNA helicase RecG|nr:ATP-dependent DNA helicase RecG [Prevotellaceae bacterium]